MGAYDSGLGEQIKNAVDGAISSQNFSQLNKDITDAVNQSILQLGVMPKNGPAALEMEEPEEPEEQLEHVEGEIVNGDAKADLEARRRAAEQNKKANSGGAGTNYGANGSTNRQYSGRTASTQNYTNYRTNTSGFDPRRQAAERRSSQYQQFWDSEQERKRRREENLARRGTSTQTAKAYYNTQTSFHEVRVQNQKDGSYVPVAQHPKGAVSGVLLSILGGFGLFGGLAMLLTFLPLSAMEPNVFLPLTAFLAMPFTAISGGIFLSGRKKRKRVHRFRQYVRQLRGRAYCAIHELSSHIGKSDKYVVDDLREMIALGMFPEGHIDEQGTCVMLNGETYDQYCKAQKGFRERTLEETLKKEESSSVNSAKEETNAKEENGNKKLSPEVEKILTNGRNYMKQIREANEAIPGEVISRKLDFLEKIIGKIYTRIEEHPEQVGELDKFVKYYLPTTLKLVNAYREFDAQPMQGENIINSKREIESTLDTISFAFEKLLDSLYEDDALDISTDISVLHTMLAQEGLTKGAFTQEQEEGIKLEL